MERKSKYVIAGLVLASIYFGNLKYNLNKIESLKADLRSTRETIIKEDVEYYSTKDKEFIIQDGKIRVPFPLCSIPLIFPNDILIEFFISSVSF